MLLHSLNPFTHPLQYPKASLIALFIIWKLVILLVAFASPGSGYDSSTSLLISQFEHGASLESASRLGERRILGRLIRWDAIYFTQIAHRGYRFEQEWAFGWGFTRLTALLSAGVSFIGLANSPYAEALAGVAMAHISHLLSALVLHGLSVMIFQSVKKNEEASAIAFLSACLHVISPAGIFLSAPYAESVFALFQFVGFFFYAKSFEEQRQGRMVRRDLSVIASGLSLGLATTIRSNGILSGMIFAYDAVLDATTLIFYDGRSATLQKLVIEVFGGLSIAIGAVFPQYLAYLEYCTDQIVVGERRLWCSNKIPSVYAWVQRYYWNSGFLRYWTASNIPLFILAIPMLFLLFRSGIWAVTATSFYLSHESHEQDIQQNRPKSNRSIFNGAYPPTIVRRFALPQLALALLALTNHHVQIIIRLSSGYPVLYWWLASAMVTTPKGAMTGIPWISSMAVVRLMVMYAIIQGGLFSSFLPPA